MAKYLFEITSYYQGITQTNRTIAPDEETAIRQIKKNWVNGVEIIKVEQKTWTPVKAGTPKIC